jgi:hypothetical protein
MLQIDFNSPAEFSGVAANGNHFRFRKLIEKQQLKHLGEQETDEKLKKEAV